MPSSASKERRIGPCLFMARLCKSALWVYYINICNKGVFPYFFFFLSIVVFHSPLSETTGSHLSLFSSNSNQLFRSNKIKCLFMINDQSRSELTKPSSIKQTNMRRRLALFQSDSIIKIQKKRKECSKR